MTDWHFPLVARATYLITFGVARASEPVPLRCSTTYFLTPTPILKVLACVAIALLSTLVAESRRPVRVVQFYPSQLKPFCIDFAFPHSKGMSSQTYPNSNPCSKSSFDKTPSGKSITTPSSSLKSINACLAAAYFTFRILSFPWAPKRRACRCRARA